MASKLNVSRESGKLIISYSWRSGAVWFLVFFSVVWNGFIAFFLLSGASGFIAFHLLAGIFIAWLTLTRLFNKTDITVDRQKLLVENGPIPWPGAKDQNIPARALVQLYVDRSNVKVNDQPTFNLVAKLDTGVTVKLIKAEQDRQVLQELETVIETYLDIENDASFDLSPSGHGKLDLEQMKANLEQMKKLKKWLPDVVVKKMELAEEKILAETGYDTASAGASSAPAPRAGSAGTSAPASSRSGADDDFSRRSSGGPKPLPEPEHDFVFPTYRAAAGSGIHFRNEGYTVGRSAQIDFSASDIDFGRQFELRPGSGGRDRYFYTQRERGRWTYFQERRLDDDEVAALGFTNAYHPTRFENGDDRYYPRDEQTGNRYVGSHGQAIRQFIYFSTASSTQFRALQANGRGWEVYVMEVVDAGDFAA